MKNLNRLSKQPSDNYLMLVPAVSDEDRRAQKDLFHRLANYVTWLDENGRSWREPALSEYRDYLLETRRLAPSTVNGQIATIRSRLNSLIESGVIHEALRTSIGSQLNEETLDDAVQNIRDAIDVKSTRVNVPESEPEYLRLSKDDILQLLDSFNEILKELDEFLEDPDEAAEITDETRNGIGQFLLSHLRDRAIIALMYITGLRENELCALDVKDLNQEFESQPALHVPDGRGCVERLIPYGGLIWALDYVNKWLLCSGIKDGPVFRGLYKGGSYRSSNLSIRALEYILASHPIEIDGEEVKIRPMDLRRAYARLLYESGMTLQAIGENLGVNDINTVLDYVGAARTDTRIPPSIER